ncbi:hypothetical protein [Paenibacillus campinasensis]|uniref:Uncharacterized protein n=1 Tax=Paenibacillus campinasensis TaxID=66347 RepID=A0A268EI45_9BACL|nr:hypothetical protein [Paenibacillus campinasensis]PAD72808.1 hypothetical protein CHH67_21100 [Paenibacillus campinasensis]
MKISVQKHKEEGRTAGFEVELICKSEAEFRKAFEEIKGVDGVRWCGCPVEEDEYYSDMIAYLPKVPGVLVSELQDEARAIARECKYILKSKNLK